MQDALEWENFDPRKRNMFRGPDPFSKNHVFQPVHPDSSWKFEPALGVELSRTAAALGRLAPAIHALEKTDAPSLLRDLQRVRNDNTYLIDLIHKQQQTMERQAQENAILSQELARVQSLLVQKKKSGVSGSESPISSRDPSPRKAMD